MFYIPLLTVTFVRCLQEKHPRIRLTVENKFLCMDFMTNGSMKDERKKNNASSVSDLDKPSGCFAISICSYTV